MSINIINKKKYVIIALIFILLWICLPVIPVVALDGIRTDNNPQSIIIDPSTNLIYVSNLYSNNIDVIEYSGKLVYRINTSTYPDQLAIEPSVHGISYRIFVTNPIANVVSVIDPLTNKIIDTIHVQKYPHGLAMLGDRLFVANFFSGTVSVIENYNESVIKNIPVGSGPALVASNPITGKIYVTNDRDNSVSVITQNPKVITKDIEKTSIKYDVTKINGFNQPTGIGIDDQENKIYICNFGNSTISVIDGNIDRPVKNILLHAVGGNAGGNGMIAVSSAEGRPAKVYVAGVPISIIDGDTYQVKNLTLSSEEATPSAITVYQGNRTSLVYVAKYSNTISVINGTTDKEQVGLTYNINPSDAGSIDCDGKTISATHYVYYEIGKKVRCHAEANPGFIFSSWSSDLEHNPADTTPASTLTDYLFSSSSGNQKDNNSMTFTASEYGTVNGNFRINPVTTISVPTELYGAIYVFILSIIIPAVLVWFFGKRRKRYLNSYINAIDDIYDNLHQNKDECLVRLRSISSDVMKLLKKDKITESHFQILTDRISQYMNELEKRDSGKSPQDLT